jgi:hypothetical protein
MAGFVDDLLRKHGHCPHVPRPRVSSSSAAR